jgi:hypothetical protein
MINFRLTVAGGNKSLPSSVSWVETDRSSSVDFFGVVFAPPHVKTGRLAPPGPSGSPYMSNTTPFRLCARSWHFEWRSACVRRMKMGRTLLQRFASSKLKSPSEKLRSVINAREPVKVAHWPSRIAHDIRNRHALLSGVSSRQSCAGSRFAQRRRDGAQRCCPILG